MKSNKIIIILVIFLQVRKFEESNYQKTQNWLHKNITQLPNGKIELPNIHFPHVIHINIKHISTEYQTYIRYTWEKENSKLLESLAESLNQDPGYISTIINFNYATNLLTKLENPLKT